LVRRATRFKILIVSRTRTVVRIWCDFNGEAEPDAFRLEYAGSQRDLEKQGVILRPGLEVTLYMEDELLDGRAALLLVDAVVEEHPRFGFIARTKADSWRHEPQ
jgi:hypothetical protein